MTGECHEDAAADLGCGYGDGSRDEDPRSEGQKACREGEAGGGTEQQAAESRVKARARVQRRLTKQVPSTAQLAMRAASIRMTDVEDKRTAEIALRRSCL